MSRRFGWVLIGLMACTSATTAEEPAKPDPESTPEAPAAPETPATPETPETPPTPPTAPAVTVQMTAATLADDCGGDAPAPQAKAKAKRSEMAAESSARMAKRACQQTSMQLAVVAAADAGRAQLAVAKVELFDDAGALLGELTARAPSVWADDGTYQAWDEAISGGQELSVTYALSEPPWDDVSDRRSRTYVLKAALTIDGDEQLVQREVEVAAPTILPPNVKT